MLRPEGTPPGMMKGRKLVPAGLVNRLICSEVGKAWRIPPLSGTGVEVNETKSTARLLGFALLSVSEQLSVLTIEPAPTSTGFPLTPGNGQPRSVHGVVSRRQPSRTRFVSPATRLVASL